MERLQPVTCSQRIGYVLALAILLPHGLAAAADETVKFQKRADSIEVLIDGKAFTTYCFGPKSPKPYMAPLRSAQGTVVTRGFPMRTDIPGERHDHPHHRGLFFAHGDINGIDFWGEGQANKASQTVNGVYYPIAGELPTGSTVFQKLDQVKSHGKTGDCDGGIRTGGP